MRPSHQMLYRFLAQPHLVVQRKTRVLARHTLGPRNATWSIQFRRRRMIRLIRAWRQTQPPAAHRQRRRWPTRKPSRLRQTFDLSWARVWPPK